LQLVELKLCYRCTPRRYLGDKVLLSCCCQDSDDYIQSTISSVRSLCPPIQYFPGYHLILRHHRKQVDTAKMVKAKVADKVKTRARVDAKKEKETDKTSLIPSGKQHASVTSASCCCECGEAIGESTKALQCERCVVETWKCVACLGFSDDLYDELTMPAKNSLHWFCPKCEESVLEHPLYMSDKIADTLGKLNDKTQGIEHRLIENFDRIEQQLLGRINAVEQMLEKKVATAKMDDFQKKMEDKVESILSRLDTKTEDSVQIKEVHERIEQKVDALATNVGMTTGTKDNVEDLLLAKLHEDKLEEEEIQKRKTSVIIHGLVEPQGNTPEERKQQDEDIIETLLHSLNLDDISVDNIIRLGKRPDQTDVKPRPVKVVIASEKQKIRVLSKAKNLPRKEEGADSTIFMHQDLTPKQRVRRQELVAELKKRQSQGEKNLIIVNWKIVERRSSRKEDV